MATTVLKVAAERCFFDVKMPLLQKLAKKLGMGQSGSNIYDLCKALVEKILDPISPERVADILALRALANPDPMPAHLPAAMLEDVMEEDEWQAWQDPLLAVNASA